MIWRIMERLFALASIAPTVSSSAAYAIMTACSNKRC
jgi:hypothetical protein